MPIDMGVCYSNLLAGRTYLKKPIKGAIRTDRVPELHLESIRLSQVTSKTYQLGRAETVSSDWIPLIFQPKSPPEWAFTSLLSSLHTTRSLHFQTIR